MPEGQIVKAVSGFYYVHTADGDLIQCRARGVFKFKKKEQSLLVGDWVQFDVTGLDEGVITFVQPRHTELTRPPIANVDQAIVVCALKQPHFTQMPLDRFLVHAEHEGLDILICLTKRDLVRSQEEVERVKSIYARCPYRILVTSVQTGEGMSALKEALQGKTSVLAGQSGVGKTSLLNQLLPELQLETGHVSKRIGRGRHTTRQVQLLSLPDGGQVADTPGFSQLHFQGFAIEDMRYYFPEFHDFADQCQYRRCLHIQEQGCQVRAALEAGEIDKNRYRHYVKFCTEIQKQRSYK